MSTWRPTARLIIAAVLDQYKDKDEKEIRKALRDAYPFGERKYHPYKIWLDEIQVQTGKRRFGIKKKPIDKQQLDLF